MIAPPYRRDPPTVRRERRLDGHPSPARRSRRRLHVQTRQRSAPFSLGPSISTKAKADRPSGDTYSRRKRATLEQEPPMTASTAQLTTRETEEIERANASGRTPVVFVHGLWLLASSWDPWRGVFEAHGYTTLPPGWAEHPPTG